ncbi:MAG TPA: hypothetical protein VF576_08530 [Rubricoccaceae bacterium]|jgi:hypothetical protein
MRLFSALALATCLCGPSAAQTNYADSTGYFVSVRDFSVLAEDRYALDAVVGRRLSPALDVGVRVQHAQRGDLFGPYSVRTSVGLGGGLTRPLGRGVSGRVEAAALYTRRRSTSFWVEPGGTQGTDVTLVDHDLAGDVVATVSRGFRLVGSVRARPTAGVYGDAEVYLDRTQTPASVPGFFTGSRSVRPYLEGGLHAELPVTFRVFGQEAAVVPYTRLRLADSFGAVGSGRGRSSAYAGGGFRLNL